MQISKIYEPIQDGLIRVNENLKSATKLGSPFLIELLDHVLDTEGKRIRPAITLLTSNFQTHDNNKTEIMATAVELLHIATLIHDDIIDDADFRRGKSTISSLWGRNIAVLLGDYLFAASATHVCDTEHIKVIRSLAETIMHLSSGQLQELSEIYNYNQTVEQYFERISNKTASLFSTSGESGALLSGMPENIVISLKEYSHNLGMAFQIVDDILDFEGTEEEVGKPLSNDLSRGIMTLPSILTRIKYPDDNAIRNLFEQPDNEEFLKRSVEIIRNSSSIKESYLIVEQFGDRAKQSLINLPQTPSRNSLEDLVDYIINRHK